MTESQIIRVKTAYNWIRPEELDVIFRGKGSYVLFRPPGSDNKTFHFEGVVYQDAPRFEEQPINILKVDQWYLHRDDPLMIFKDFEAAGFTFVDTPMDDEQYDRLSELCSRARRGK